MFLARATNLKNCLSDRLTPLLTEEGVKEIHIINDVNYIRLNFSFIDTEDYNKFIHFVLSHTSIDFSVTCIPFQKSFDIKIFDATTVDTDLLNQLLNDMHRPLPTLYRTMAFHGGSQQPSIVTPESSQETMGFEV